MRVLIVDNTLDQDSWGSHELSRSVRRPGVTVSVRRAPHDDLPSRYDLHKFDRIVLSGSRTSAMANAPWIENLHEFIRATISLGKPLLGVCYGHQSIARAIARSPSDKSVVALSETPELGWSEIEITEFSALLSGLPQRFFSFSSHFDEVQTLPSGAKNLARSARCLHQAFQLEGLPIFGIQFHPEKSLEEANQTLAKKRPPDQRRAFLRATEGAKLYSAQVGAAIFENFLKLDANGARP